MHRSGTRRGLLARVGCVVVAAGAAVLLVNVGSASADTVTPQSAFNYTSAPGDYLGGGQSGSYESPASVISAFTTPNQPGSVAVSGQNPDGSDGWQVGLDAPIGEQLYPGTYQGAEDPNSVTGRRPGIYVVVDGHFCDTEYGQFTIYQAGIASSGTVNTLDASFTVHCDSPTAPALTGTVRYQALPLNYSFTSSPGDYLGQGQSATYTNDTSVFTLTGNATRGIGYDVSGANDNWTIGLAPTVGQTLQAGQTYDNAQRTATSANPGLQVLGDNRQCDSDTGSFTINDLVTDSAGNITNLSATFTQYCNGSDAALTGQINYFAGSWSQSESTPPAVQSVRAS